MYNTVTFTNAYNIQALVTDSTTYVLLNNVVLASRYFLLEQNKTPETDVINTHKGHTTYI